jgi:trimeric autotransporter adhesin
MNRLPLSLANRAFLLVILVVFSALGAGAQSSSVPARITEPVNEKSVLTLKGNVHPLARAEFDQGAAPLDLPMNRMLLVHPVIAAAPLPALHCA